MTADTTVTLRGHTIGAGPNVYIGGDHIQPGAADVRSGEEPRPGRDGVTFGAADLLGGRDLLIPVTLRSTAATKADRILEVEDLAGDIGQAWRPAAVDLALAWNTGGARTFVAYGRPRPLQIGSLARMHLGVVTGLLRFRMTQPYLFDSSIVQTVIAAQAVAATAGLGYPHGYPHSYGAAATQGAATHTAGGRINTWPMIVLRADPLDTLRDPTVINDATGERLGLDLTVDQSVQAVVDMYRQRVYLTAVGVDVMIADPAALALADRSAAVRHPTDSDWWHVPPSATQVRLTANGAGTARVLTRGAYTL